MKVIIIADNLGGGAARLGKNLIESLAEKIGWGSLIILGNARIDLDPKSMTECFEFSEVKTRWLPRFMQRYRFIKRFSSDYVVLNLTNFPLGSLFKKEKKEICLLHSAYFFATPPDLHAFGLKFILKVILARRTLFKLLTLFSSASKTVFIVQTPWMKTLAQKSLPSKFMLDVARLHSWPISSKPNTENEPMDKSSKPDEEVVWFYPATAEPHKNHFLLFDLFSEALKKRPYMKLIVTLPFEEVFTNRLMESLKSLSIENAVQNVGWVNESQKNHLLKACSGAIFLSEFESLGIPLLEIRELSKSAVVMKSHASEYILGTGSHMFDLKSENVFTKKFERERVIKMLSSCPAASTQYSEKNLVPIRDSYFFDWVQSGK